jgi:hypothetical protein
MDKISKLTKSEVVQIYNYQLNIFFSDLVNISKELDEDISSNKSHINKLLLYKKLIEVGIAVNKELAIEMFATYIFKKENKDFCEKIAAKDYEYFINNQNYDSTNRFEDLINTIKDLFIQLTESNKDSIFIYLKNLSTLAKIYIIKKTSNT